MSIRSLRVLKKILAPSGFVFLCVIVYIPRNNDTVNTKNYFLPII